jgi:hypothetical protein
MWYISHPRVLPLLRCAVGLVDGTFVTSARVSLTV